jgi:hypothetical protein
MQPNFPKLGDLGPIPLGFYTAVTALPAVKITNSGIYMLFSDIRPKHVGKIQL